MFKILKAPYPLEKNFRIVIPRLLLSGLLIYFILVVFQPFGLNNHYGTDLLIYSAGFVVVGITYLLLHFLIIEPYFKESKWNIGREILNQLVIVLIIGFSNSVYYSLYEGDKLRWFIVLAFMFYTIIISLFPITLIIFIRQNRLLKLYLNKANEMSLPKIENKDKEGDDCFVKLKSKNLEKKYSINCHDLILLHAQDNYILLFYIDKGQVCKELIRNTMIQCSKDLKHFNMFYRCHRSYIVNLNNIESIQGNAQGLKLKLKFLEDIVPVSRHLIKEFTAKMSS